MGTLITVALMELGLGLWYPVGGQNYRVDRDLLHEARRGSRRLQLMPAGSDQRHVLVEINEDGMRGPRVDPAHRRPRVLLLGDSLVLAGNSPEGDTLRAQLDCLLSGRVEVLNAGRESYGPDQTLLWLQREGQALAPDVVVLILCAHNDSGDLMRNQLFELGPNGALVRRYPEMSSALRMRFEQRYKDSRDMALLRWWRAQFAVPRLGPNRDPDQLVADWYAAALQQHGDYLEDGGVVRDLEHDTWDADVALVPDARSAHDKLALLSAVLEELHKEATARGARAVALVVPSAVDIDLSYPIRPDPSKWEQYDPDRLVTRITAAAEVAGWETHDLAPALRAAGPERVFVGGEDIHWNARGQGIAAGLLADRVRDLLVLK